MAEAIKNNVLIIPGNVFSMSDTHFRISYAVDDATLARGLEVLLKVVRWAAMMIGGSRRVDRGRQSKSACRQPHRRAPVLRSSTIPANWAAQRESRWLRRR